MAFSSGSWPYPPDPLSSRSRRRTGSFSSFRNGTPLDVRSYFAAGCVLAQRRYSEPNCRVSGSILDVLWIRSSRRAPLDSSTSTTCNGGGASRESDGEKGVRRRNCVGSLSDSLLSAALRSRGFGPPAPEIVDGDAGEHDGDADGAVGRVLVNGGGH